MRQWDIVDHYHKDLIEHRELAQRVDPMVHWCLETLASDRVVASETAWAGQEYSSVILPPSDLMLFVEPWHFHGQLPIPSPFGCETCFLHPGGHLEDL